MRLEVVKEAFQGVRSLAFHGREIELTGSIQRKIREGERREDKDPRTQARPSSAVAISSRRFDGDLS